MQGHLMAPPTPPASLGADAVRTLEKSGGERIRLFPPERLGKAILPPPANVDMVEELTRLERELGHLHLEEPLQGKMLASLKSARREAVARSRNRQAIGEELNRALKTASRADDFPQIIESIRPNVVRAVSWLGKSWYRILPVVGLSF